MSTSPKISIAPSTSEARLRWLLGMLGLIPFIGASLMVTLDLDLGSADPVWIFISYSAVILSFVSGSLWGRCLTAAPFSSKALIVILTNGVALLAWAGLLLSSPRQSIIITLASGYAVILYFERRYRDALSDGHDPRYLTLRIGLTYTVLIAHAVVYFNL